MNTLRLLAIASIIVIATAAWMILGQMLTERTEKSHEELSQTVAGNWGTSMTQLHPEAFYISPTVARAKRSILPETSNVSVDLRSDPQKKGLLWYRTYTVDYSANYTFRNPTPISQTIYVNFNFPAMNSRFDKFSFTLGDTKTDKAPRLGAITEAVILAPGETTPVNITYVAAGMDRWTYTFGDTQRVRGFQLDMQTDFHDIDIPAGSESPTTRDETDSGKALQWKYDDLIGANSIAMEMPAATNPGPVAARITFFAPISLIFFFGFLVVIGLNQGVNLHPMNYVLLAAGCFAFQLLFVYLLDLIPVNFAFVISAAISLLLVVGYLAAVAGTKFAKLAAVAQFGFMVLFSYSFFFEGMTGITITIGAVITLAFVMAYTAKTDWNQVAPLNRKQIPGSA